MRSSEESLLPMCVRHACSTTSETVCHVEASCTDAVNDTSRSFVIRVIYLWVLVAEWE